MHSANTAPERVKEEIYLKKILVFNFKDHTYPDKVAQHIINILLSKYEITTLGETKNLLGIIFEETEEGILIHQQDYIENLKERFKLYNILKSTLPISKDYCLSKRLSLTTTE